MHCLKTFLRTPSRQRASHHRTQKASKRSRSIPTIKIRPPHPSDPLTGTTVNCLQTAQIARTFNCCVFSVVLPGSI